MENNKYIWHVVRELMDEAWNAFNHSNTWVMEANGYKADGVVEFLARNYKEPKTEAHIASYRAEIDRLFTKRFNCFSW